MNQRNYARDLLASIVVFLVALPLCMGVAIASGVPPERGLITGIIGGIFVGAIGGSPLQVSGPAAGLAVIVFELVQDHGLVMLGPVLILGGLIQVAAGLLKLGKWFRAMSPAVVHGMLAGIGILIFAGQFHVMVDDKPRSSGIDNLLSVPASIYKGIFPMEGTNHHFAAAIGLLTIAVIVLWNQFRPKGLKLVPGALLGVVIASASAQLLQLPILRVKLPDSLLSSVHLPAVADLTQLASPTLLLAAFALAFVASAETLLSAAAVDQMHNGPRAQFDRELAAQGLGNALCGVLGALPMTGVIVRSSANVQAGATSRFSAIFHGIWLLGLVAFAPHVLRLIPTAALAAILVHTGFKLVDLAKLKQLHQYGRFPVAIYAGTVIGIVCTDLLTGVLIGIGLTIAKLVYKSTHLKASLTIAPDGTRADMHLKGSATFLRLPELVALLEQVPPGTELHVHIGQLAYIDHSCLDLFHNWRDQKKALGSRLYLDWEELEARFQSQAA